MNLIKRTKKIKLNLFKIVIKKEKLEISTDKIARLKILKATHQIIIYDIAKPSADLRASSSKKDLLEVIAKLLKMIKLLRKISFLS